LLRAAESTAVDAALRTVQWRWPLLCFFHVHATSANEISGCKGKREARLADISMSLSGNCLKDLVEGPLANETVDLALDIPSFFAAKPCLPVVRAYPFAYD